jgi:hypothetical protein
MYARDRDASTAATRALGARTAAQLHAEVAASSFRRGYPGSNLPWGIVPHVLGVAAVEVGYPVPLSILVEIDDAPRGG